MYTYCNSVIKWSFSSSCVRRALWICRLRNILFTGLKSSPNTCGFQVVFHWVSKLIHLTRMRRSGWVTTLWIMNEFEKCISRLAYRSQFSDGIYFFFVQLYFEKGCREKSTRQSQMLLLVFRGHCSSKTFERMTREAMDIRLRVLEESNKSRFDNYSIRNSIFWSYAILPVGIVTCTFFPTTFLELNSSV